MNEKITYVEKLPWWFISNKEGIQRLAISTMLIDIFK
jgi:hypothetical protein